MKKEADTEFHLPGANGDNPDDESQEQLQAAKKTLDELIGHEGTSMVTMGKEDKSLLKTIATPDEEHKRESFWRLLDFLDYDEALDHVAAFFEALDLGMDTSFNIAFANSLVSTNRNLNKSNLISTLTDTVQHGKWATNWWKKGDKHGANPRSPIG